MSDKNSCNINAATFPSQCIHIPDSDLEEKQDGEGLEEMRGNDDDEKFIDPENPYNAYELDARNVFKSGPYKGEVLANCRAQNGDVRVMGAYFDGRKLAALRKFLNLGNSKAYFDKESLVREVICIEANQRPFNKWAMEALRHNCPTSALSQKECNAVAQTIEDASKEETFIEKMLEVSLGFGILVPIAGSAVFWGFSFFKHRAIQKAASSLVLTECSLIRTPTLAEIARVNLGGLRGRIPPLLMLVGLGVTMGLLWKNSSDLA